MLCISEVKFAHNFAVRRNFTHEVNFTIEDNFTCPKDKLSFSVFSVKDNTLNDSGTFFQPCFFKTSRINDGIIESKIRNTAKKI